MALATQGQAPIPIAATIASPCASDIEPAADENGLDPALAAYGIEKSRPTAIVMMLTLPDVAEAVAHWIACAAQGIAAAHAIPYIKMLGTTMIAAVGYTTEATADLLEAAPRLADAAIALREYCSALLDSDVGPAGLGLGLDVGSIFGARLGEAPGMFNLWGEAVQGAKALAASAPAEGIQASEHAYLLLRQHFLCRPRGLFYRPHTGEARSYILAGRA